MPLRSLPSHLRRTLFAVVLFALVVAQTLAILHRIVHAVAVADATPSASASAVDGLKALFAGHRGEHGCELYDQLHHADPVRVDAQSVTALRVGGLTATCKAATIVAAMPAAARARGPPRMS